MNESNDIEEPLNNVELESAALGIKMALDEEEEQEARAHFINVLRDSHLAIPTATPTPTNPDGSLVPGADIQFIVVQDAEGTSGVPSFTALLGLKSSLPQLEHGVFLNGAQLGGILGNSELVLFVDGPGIHVSVSNDELRSMAASAQQSMEAHQAAAQHNEGLETALAIKHNGGGSEADEQIVQSFLEGFARIPVATTQDPDKPSLLLTMGNNEGGEEAQQIPLLVSDGALLCFSGDRPIHEWNSEEHPAISLPGAMIAQMAAQAGVPKIQVNPASADTVTIEVGKDRLVVV